MAYIQDGITSLINQTYIFDDLLNTITWDLRASGTGANQVIGTLAGRPGLITLNTGTTTTGFSQCNFLSSNASNAGNFIFGGGSFTWVGSFNIVQLANVTDDFQYYVGIHDGWQFGGPSNGVYFQYIRANSLNWQIVSNNGGTATTTTSTTPVTSGFHKLIISATATQATFYVDGVNVGTINTNLPTVNAVSLCGHVLKKTAGTTSVSSQQDYFEFYENFTTGR
jgi:hypothetical protein